jgi:predicted RNA-binding Zn ribbon-like protein
VVNSHSEAPSRAASLTLIGGELALDFCNTSSGRGFPTHQEHLREAPNVVDWAVHARVLPPEDGEWLHTAVAQDSALSNRLIREALALREDLYLLASDIAAGRPAPTETVDRLTRVHAQCLAQAKLAPHQTNFMWTWSTRSAPVEAVLGPISLSALTTLLRTDLTRVKQCQGEKCGWLFVDSTKNRLRRWCEMEVCGNRAKQKRHGAKARGE